MSLALDEPVRCEMESVSAHEEKKSADLRTEADVALVSLAQTGDFRAFEELVRRYRNKVFAVAYHFTRDREEAWDTSQEVFVKAHRGLRRFRGEASFKTWLMRITVNQCKDYVKKRRLYTVAEEPEQLERAPSPQVGPRQAVEAEEIGQVILEGLDALPSKHRAAFVLREFEGLSYEEMAQAMGCRLGTVMSRLHHARRKLQQFLVRQGIVEVTSHG
ncbi:MAG: sigma-70 family RNA polymerase sigma factor [Candidatus Hydrogenedentes bacterium]|nr:sigma-70 family RNA polymerase sigma factor [Candidatus Hydrogenedentota bacterium]